MDSTLKFIYQQTPSQISTFFKITPKKAQFIHEELHSIDTISLIKKDAKSYHIITYFDPLYPNQLKLIPDPPYVFYARGQVHLLKSNTMLSVIGTRKPSKMARLKIEKFIKPLIEKDWLIVSGMARGIDSYAHELTLSLNGKTIAVLGGGFDNIYPKENKKLFEKIAKNGLVISEYPPALKPERYFFPERNRIISGLSFGTLVIEASKPSGTLITVDQALEQGKEIFVLPGNIFDEETLGNNELIQHGAKLVINSKDIEDEYRFF